MNVSRLNLTYDDLRLEDKGLEDKGLGDKGLEDKGQVSEKISYNDLVFDKALAALKHKYQNYIVQNNKMSVFLLNVSNSSGETAESKKGPFSIIKLIYSYCELFSNICSQ